MATEKERDTVKIYEITSTKEWGDFLNEVNLISHFSFKYVLKFEY